MRIRGPEMKPLMKIKRVPNRPYMLDTKIMQSACVGAYGMEDGGRLEVAISNMARKELVRGLPIVIRVDQLFTACLAGSNVGQPFLVCID